MAKHNIKQKFYEAFRDNIGKEYVEENSDSNAEDKIKKLSNAFNISVLSPILKLCLFFYFLHYL